MNDDKPKARRDLELVPARQGNAQVVVVRDPLGLSSGDVVLTDAGVAMLSLLDGTRDLRDLQVELMRAQGGVLISSGAVEQMIGQFDGAFLLDNERYRAARQRVVEEFGALDVRAASHAGSAYLGTADELRQWLDSLIAEGSRGEQRIVPAEITALVAPHIDPHAGRQVYASAYGALAGASPERIVILGTGHRLDDAVISLSEKDFVTPLGRAKTDVDVVRALRAAGGTGVARDDFAHRNEHSIEFQLVFLQHVLHIADRSDGETGVEIVPILCGSFQGVVERHKRAAEIPGVSALLARLREVVLDPARRTLLVAGVDFSHVGPKFGDRYSATSYEQDVRLHDEMLLEALCDQDPEAFWARERTSGGRYHVCGFSALACLLEILPPGRGEARLYARLHGQGQVLRYEFWKEQATQSGVSFAAVVFGTHSNEP
jgi:AmmeMemoRadiSam system protein B